MKNSSRILVVTLMMVGSLSAWAAGPDQAAAEASPDEQVAALEAMCLEASEAIALRHADKPLYHRLGGYSGIEGIVKDVVRRHQINNDIAHLLDGVDTGLLIKRVTDFLASATGGDEIYKGRDMVAAHSHLGLTNADFLAAGADVGAAMVAAGVGADEQQEVLCAFVGLRGEVVTR